MRILYLALTVAGVFGCDRAVQTPPSSPPEPKVAAPSEPLSSGFDRDRDLALVVDHIKSARHSDAERLLRGMLAVDPHDPEALFNYALLEQAQGNLDAAIELLDSIPMDHPQVKVAAVGLAGEICLEADRAIDALQRYLQLSQLAPASVQAHRQLAFILNRLGRRHEAARHVRVLCKLGDVRQDELHSLMVLSDAIYDDPANSNSDSKDRRHYYPLGASGVARKLFSEQKFAEAAEVLEPSLSESQTAGAVSALYGRCIAEAQDDQRFADWIRSVDDSVRENAEYWSAVGAWLVNEQRFEESVRALCEAIIRDPTDARSYRRMIQALIALGRNDESKKWEQRHQLLRGVTLASNRVGETSHPDPALFDEIVTGLESLDRPLESILWKAIQTHLRQSPPDVSENLNQVRVEIVESGKSFPDIAERLCGLNYEAFPLVDLAHEFGVKRPVPLGNNSVAADETPRFENVAGSIGLEHAFNIASQYLDSGFMIYQAVGGGVAVVDFDLDGATDLFFAQGGGDPPTMIGVQTDQLFRQLDGRVQDVTDLAGTRDRTYSTGVTSGDWNQDGFPDLVVANLGVNRLLINNGDGTFRIEDTDDSDRPTRMSTSIAMADLSGDALPDIYELNYVDDPEIDAKPEVNDQGEMQIVAPSDYEPAMDRLLINDGAGNRIVSDIGRSDDDRSTGLGIVIADFDSAPGTEIYIGNDVRPNQLWKKTDTGGWSDMASMTGTAVGHDGLRTASMGIAVGDYDRSGTIDFHITNFENSPARLYLSRGNGFQDRASSMRIDKDSFRVLGFGTQAIDYNNDGWQDLIVTNGHVENTNNPSSPYEQPAQLFVNHGDHFELTPVEDPSGYFGTPHVGRALARLDFNQDGKSDFVVTHLQSPSALLINRTETAQHWLQIELVGIQCERDAIGARIELRQGDQTWVNWMVAGDGYLCRNESAVVFGLGAADEIESLTVTWPDETVQVFHQVPANHRYLILQNEPTLHLR